MTKTDIKQSHINVEKLDENNFHLFSLSDINWGQSCQLR